MSCVRISLFAFAAIVGCSSAGSSDPVGDASSGELRTFDDEGHVVVRYLTSGIQLELRGDYARALYHSLGFVDRNPFAGEGETRHRSTHQVHCRLDLGMVEVDCVVSLPADVTVQVVADEQTGAEYVQIANAPLQYGAVTSIAHAIAMQVQASDDIYFYAVANSLLQAVRMADRESSTLLISLDGDIPCSESIGCPTVPTDEDLLALPEFGAPEVP